MLKKIINHEVFPLVFIMLCLVMIFVIAVVITTNAEYYRTVKMCDTAIECVSILCGK